MCMDRGTGWQVACTSGDPSCTAGARLWRFLLDLQPLARVTAEVPWLQFPVQQAARPNPEGPSPQPNEPLSGHSDGPEGTLLPEGTPSSRPRGLPLLSDELSPP